ncbi:IS30 family transposase, partial [Lactobacillus delbrueckii subsp. lactis]|nr:IS30 family transposase [Lactobacillus delbrueckii subsp. lactis]
MDHSYSNTKPHQKASTVGYELKRGTVSLYTGNVKRYKAVEGQSTYELHRSECGRK